jgi:TonB family protein
MSDKSNKTKGIAGTIVVHLAVILLMFLFAFTTPLPLPGGGEIMINFGSDEEGSGVVEPKKEIITETAVAQKQVEEKGKEEPLTQDFEEAPSLNKKTEKKKVETKKVVKTTPVKTQQKVTETKTEEVVKPKEVNKKALFPGQKTDGGTTGEGDTDKQGNQGSKDGSVDSENRTGGTGDGQGGGEGDGIGPGKGIGFDLGGRGALYLPKPDYSKQIGGTVVVQVTVDRDGKVTKVVGGAKGSTTNDSDLVKAAEKAAIQAKFDVSKNAPASQIGTITYVFKMK